MSLVFEGVVSVVAKSLRKIVNGVSGKCSAGETLAILGPSGAGKTSLLNLLTLSPTGCNSYGTVTLNGTPMTQHIFRKSCCLVEQLDAHRAFLTCRETVRYTIDFYEPSMNAEEKEIATETMLIKLGLNGCKDIKVGNQFIQGLSGGQKKRLSVAVALCKKPDVLFLDEPTSGLDAGSAEGIITFVKDLAKDFNIIVVLTVHVRTLPLNFAFSILSMIACFLVSLTLTLSSNSFLPISSFFQQPSSKIYFNFDNVLLMSQGRAAYCGTPQGSVDYFASMGHVCPPLSNPADYLLSEINHEFTDPDSVEKILNNWENNSKKLSLMSSISTSTSTEEVTHENDNDNDDREKLPWLSEFGFVLRRQCKIVVTDPMVYLGRGLGFIFITSFFAVIYIESRHRDQTQLMNRLFFLMWLMGVPTSMGVVAVYVYSDEFKTIEKEVRNGMYSLSSFLLSSFLIQVPACFLLAICAAGISGFGMINLYVPNFFEIISMYALMLFAFECIARCMSVIFTVPLIGMLGYMNIWFTSFLFSGIMVPEDQIIYPFRVLVWLLPLNWGMSTIAWLDINDSTYKGAYLCEKDSGRTDCLNHFDSNGQRKWPGWTCSKAPNGEYNPTQCLGYTGGQALDSIGITFESISSFDNLGRNMSYNTAISLTVWLFYVIFAYLRVLQVTTVQPLSDLEEKKNHQTQKNGNDDSDSDSGFEMIPTSETESEIASRTEQGQHVV